MYSIGGRISYKEFVSGATLISLSYAKTPSGLEALLLPFGESSI